MSMRTIISLLTERKNGHEQILFVSISVMSYMLTVRMFLTIPGYLAISLNSSSVSGFWV